MAWRPVKRLAVTSDEPLIIINNRRFSYNIAFVKLAEVEKKQYVKYYVDDEERKIGFEFTEENDPDFSSKVTGSRKQGFVSYSVDLFSMEWIKKAYIKGLNKYRPIRDGKKWIISLRPVFENSIKRDDIDTIGENICGIYRYIDEGRIVYIGKGVIKNRAKEEQRKEWKYEKIEYSTIIDDEKQFEWESYWIDEYKKQSNGLLPTYNLISGRSKN